MRTTSATFGDLLYVFDHLSEQNRSEHEAMGLRRWQVLKQARQWINEWKALTGWLDGKPAFIFGVIGVEQKMTWFLGTEAYFAAGAAGVLGARKVLRKALAEHGPMYAVSQSPRSDAERWFTLLGFRKVAEEPERRVFLYG